jgi:hypothetical protein
MCSLCSVNVWTLAKLNTVFFSVLDNTIFEVFRLSQWFVETCVSVGLKYSFILYWFAIVLKKLLVSIFRTEYLVLTCIRIVLDHGAMRNSYVLIGGSENICRIRNTSSVKGHYYYPAGKCI